MATLMVLAMQAADGDVEDTQRRDFSREALGAYDPGFKLPARSEQPR